MKVKRIKRTIACLGVRSLLTMGTMITITTWVAKVDAKTVDVQANTQQVQVEQIFSNLQGQLYILRKTVESSELSNNTSEEVAEAKKVVAEHEIIEREQKARREKAIKGKKTGKGIIYNIPEEWYSEFKAYMGYTAVTSIGSDQYQLLNSEDADTDENGLRTYKGRYCIALGSGFASKIGTKIDLVLTNGTVIHCVLGDQKANCDTNRNHMTCIHNGSVAEFIVDNRVFASKKDGSGTVNWVTTEAGSFDGKIKKVIVLGDETKEVDIGDGETKEEVDEVEDVEITETVLSTEETTEEVK